MHRVYFKQVYHRPKLQGFHKDMVKAQRKEIYYEAQDTPQEALSPSSAIIFRVQT
jgi:hypothetical protein